MGTVVFIILDQLFLATHWVLKIGQYQLDILQYCFSWGIFSRVVHLDQSCGNKNIWWPEFVSFTDSSSEGDEDDSVLTRAGRLLTRKADYLPSGIVDITRIKDANIDKPSNVSQKYNQNIHVHVHYRLYWSEEILLLAKLICT